MNRVITVALDAMGGDHGPDVVVLAAAQALSDAPDLCLILVGDERRLQEVLQRHKIHSHERLLIRHASQQVEMNDSPAQALRGKKDSSMHGAVNLVKQGVAQACVSAGNTGALMAIARYALKTLPGVDRPAIGTALPTMQGHTYMLDLGANIESSPQNLFEFAVMGSVLASAVDANPHPRVGLLNIGEEDIKGNDQVKEAAALLAASNLNYIGFVEGDDIYRGEVDVVVCDGFVGNVALKTSEGVAKMVAYYIRGEFKRNFYTRLAALAARPVLKALRVKLDPRRYNGASLLGLQGIVIKSHGGADVFAFCNAIKTAVIEVDKAIPERIRASLQSMLEQRQVV